MHTLIVKGHAFQASDAATRHGIGHRIVNVDVERETVTLATIGGYDVQTLMDWFAEDGPIYPPVGGFKVGSLLMMQEWGE